jgi:hypothetical protein
MRAAKGGKTLQQEPRGELPSAHLIPQVPLVLVNAYGGQSLD